MSHWSTAGGEVTDLKQKRELVNGEIRGFVSCRVMAGGAALRVDRSSPSPISHRGTTTKRGAQAVADSDVCPSGVSSHFLIGCSAVCWLRQIYYSPRKRACLQKLAALRGGGLEQQKHKCMCKASRSFPEGEKSTDREGRRQRRIKINREGRASFHCFPVNHLK